MRWWACLICVASVLLGCDSAQLVECGASGVHEELDGVEYCVYSGAGPGRRCPDGTTLAGQFEGGIVCASRAVTQDASIADRVCRHLEGGCDAPTDPPDAGPIDAGSSDAGDASGDTSNDATITDSGAVCSGADCTAVVEIAAGLHSTCARLASGAVYCWGGNANGTLGDGTFERRLRPVRVARLDDDIAQLSGGAVHTCALRRDGVVLCWGHNRFGALGEGAEFEVDAPEPVEVGLPEVARSVTAGEFHTCALGMSGVVYCWGLNASLQLGDASRGTLDARPTAVPGVEGAVQIDTSYAHTCALRDDGADRVVTCWGRNEDAQLGMGMATPGGQPPSEAVRGTDLEQIAVGGGHTCVRHAGGEVDCWGAASVGEAGDPELVHPRLSPFRVAGLVARFIDAGSGVTCALVDGGSARCWGANAVDASQLGAGSGIGFSAMPLAVRDVSGATSLAVGWQHACVALGGHDVRCWGSNADGELGNGEMEAAENAPVTVMGLPP